MKKGKFIIIGVIFAIIISIIVIFIYKYNSDIKRNSIKIDNYTVNNYEDIPIDKKNKKIYKANDFTLSINSYIDTYDKNNDYIIIKTNKSIIHKTDFYATKMKVFKFNDYYVIDFLNDKSQCENHKLLFIDKEGQIKKIFENKLDDWLLPIPVALLSNIEYNSNNEIVLNYKSCYECLTGEKIGYRYTYRMSGDISEVSKEDIVC